MSLARDYRDYLRAEYSTRVRRNARYSLRAFARDLGMSPANLSGILKGTHGMSRERATMVGAKLGLAGEMLETFCDLVEASHGRSESKRGGAKGRLQQLELNGYKSLDVQDLEVMQNWYEFAILEILNSKTLTNDFDSLIKGLGISKIEFESTVEKLQRLNLVRVETVNGSENPCLVPTHEHVITKPGIQSLVIRQLHSQFLNLAEDAVHFQGTDRREYSSSMIAIDIKRINEVKEELRRIRGDFIRKFQIEDGSDARLYAFCFQFFDLMRGDA